MKYLLSLLIPCTLLISGCVKKDSVSLSHSDQAKVYEPEIDPKDFSASTVVTNPYFPLFPGRKYIYEGTSEEGDERVEEIRLDETITIMGVECIVDNFKGFIDGELVEEAWDWYAQKNDGSVWYFGEAVDNYENGVVADHEGSWKAGVDGALPGIIMLADPKNGVKYREEFFEGEAEDQAQIVHTDWHLSIDFGTFDNCIMTRNWSPLEPGLIEEKIYAPNVGLVREISHREKSQIDLVAIE